MAIYGYMRVDERMTSSGLEKLTHLKAPIDTNEGKVKPGFPDHIVEESRCDGEDIYDSPYAEDVILIHAVLNSIQNVRHEEDDRRDLLHEDEIVCRVASIVAVQHPNHYNQRREKELH